MNPITRIQFWKLEQAIRSNRHLSIAPSLYYRADRNGKQYLDNDGKVWLVLNRDGYFADPATTV
jgi:hypothetical protein